MYKYFKLSLWFMLLTTFSCEVINPTEALPSYLRIEPFTLTTNERTEGTDSEKITEAWLFINGDFLGAYSLPVEVPILQSGTVEVRVEAGIKDNGIGETPEIYPFYTPYTQTITLSPSEQVVLNPTTTYEEETVFEMIEDFENTPHFFSEDRDNDVNTRITATTTAAFEGRSGRIELTTNNPFIEVATDTRRLFNADISNDGFTYLEVNYKSDVDVIFGVIGYADNNFLNAEVIFEPGFVAKSSWNKIYFNLTSLIVTGGYQSYQLVLTAGLPVENGNFSLDRAVILLDNIKLVHF